MRKKNIPIIPATSSSRARYDADRLRSANSRSGVIGCAARSSMPTKAASSPMPIEKARTVSSPLQPAVAAWTNPKTSEAIPRVEVMAPPKSNLPVRRSVSGSTRRASATTTMPIGTLTKSTQRQETNSVSRPPASRPTAAPPMQTAV